VTFPAAVDVAFFSEEPEANTVAVPITINAAAMIGTIRVRLLIILSSIGYAKVR
jgi:hypothetical protein